MQCCLCVFFSNRLCQSEFCWDRGSLVTALMTDTALLSEKPIPYSQSVIMCCQVTHAQFTKRPFAIRGSSLSLLSEARACIIPFSITHRLLYAFYINSQTSKPHFLPSIYLSYRRLPMQQNEPLSRCTKHPLAADYGLWRSISAR